LALRWKTNRKFDERVLWINSAVLASNQKRRFTKRKLPGAFWQILAFHHRKNSEERRLTFAQDNLARTDYL